VNVARALKLGPADLKAGELRGYMREGKYILLANFQGTLYALDDWCNHAGCLISGGWIEDEERAVVCPCHEYTYELSSGKNITFPRLADDQARYDVMVRDGEAWVVLPE
jgi:3-phenylpropionate/trans-cinnamate dioxygenase ferredoxin subunit